MIRVAVVERSEGRQYSEGQYADNFVRAALAANQFIYDELPFRQATRRYQSSPERPLGPEFPSRPVSR